MTDVTLFTNQLVQRRTRGTHRYCVSTGSFSLRIAPVFWSHYNHNTNVLGASHGSNLSCL